MSLVSKIPCGTVMLLCLAVGACTPSETAYLRNPQTGQTVGCFGGTLVEAKTVQDCIEGYQRKGFVPVPAPN